MEIFLTGATGWIGSAVLPELRRAGHTVTALARSGRSADAIRTAGARPAPGDLDDLDALRRGAAAADAVIHLANKHDWSDIAASNRAERAAVETLVGALEGTGRPLLLASGVAGIAVGRTATEDDVNPAVGPESPRGGTERLALDARDRGVEAVALRFAPSVHGVGDHGFIRTIADIARRTGVSGYPGVGANAWAAVHVADVARLLVRVLEQPSAAAGVVHAVAETAIPTRAIADALGERLRLPVASIEDARVPEHFGWIGGFFAADLRASADRTRARYAWEPTERGLVDDILAGAYDADAEPLRATA